MLCIGIGIDEEAEIDTNVRCAAIPGRDYKNMREPIIIVGPPVDFQVTSSSWSSLLTIIIIMQLVFLGTKGLDSFVGLATLAVRSIR